MSVSKVALLACGVVMAIGAAVPAQESGELEIRERALMYLNPTTGKMMVRQIGNKGHDMITRNGRPMSGGMIFYRDGSNIYALEDRDGAMMLDIAKGNWD